MPEHRPGTPEQLRPLESFLWHDPMVDAAEWRGWCARHWPAAPAEAATARFGQAQTLHATLRELQRRNAVQPEAAPMGAATIDALHDLIAGCDVQPFVRPSGAIGLRPGDPLDPVGLLLVLALEAMDRDQWRRFKLCRDPDCRASFFDTSKPNSKNWCDMRLCGSRHKMRRLRARKASTRRA